MAKTTPISGTYRRSHGKRRTYIYEGEWSETERETAWRAKVWFGETLKGEIFNTVPSGPIHGEVLARFGIHSAIDALIRMEE
jgi:hypothetical protein